ncbi:hypothetical protein JG687_00005459 [Phytophthora cactorum]|uniref:No apical meristem-associated C-terminal domain-containing protein n=1 Tax=Phytophthora cactorum TaxID=29920 RepID=A0A329RQZ6_9STRA|nr:hypothetical protein Pcac1_g626 [Phytophthora cactorum]KAG2813817.1 hypothetical protein PC112_g14590 [Phytophthora cactorum]KAG2821306.1 hypothetical protein PC111_g11080 [Phytophthora cactorum]KAG2852794.1 hypothetical protein PC113_g14727 [Phytophthora cactorum]KAG2894536.1 hypothetical protein PC114_g15861 [Phytophthora cactorum]
MVLRAPTSPPRFSGAGFLKRSCYSLAPTEVPGAPEPYKVAGRASSARTWRSTYPASHHRKQRATAGGQTQTMLLKLVIDLRLRREKLNANVLAAYEHNLGRADLEEQKASKDWFDRTNDDDNVLQSPVPSRVQSSTRNRASGGKKKVKQIQFEEQIDKAMMHSQRELAKATSAQVDIMQHQLVVAQKKVAILEVQQKSAEGSGGDDIDVHLNGRNLEKSIY